MAYDVNTSGAKFKFLGFSDNDVGPAGQQFIKSSISPFEPLDNVLLSRRAMEAASRAQINIALILCPDTTLSVGAVIMVGNGYANLGKGSVAICANGFAIKTSEPGAATETWIANIGS